MSGADGELYGYKAVNILSTWRGYSNEGRGTEHRNIITIYTGVISYN